VSKCLRQQGMLLSVGFMLCTAFAVQAEQGKSSKANSLLSETNEQQIKADIEWGNWDAVKAPLSRYGVGISGKVEAELNRLDRSNLLDNADGVEVQNKKPKRASKPKDIRQMMAEMEAMEAEIKQEMNNESEF